ncbi:MAG TPA: choice-of-anchor L domain-containing protein, partial [Bacteroidia bacterium]|nr:choice-of-anchor L domain-containing protein [Bacteroidia bacterium]
MKKSLLLLIFSVLVRVNGFSQLTVTSNGNATALAQAILGSGVSVSNATINCGANGAGTFNYTGSTLGLTNGIILTSGYATDASMPAQIISQTTGNNFTDPDLATIVSGSMNDVCYIAFDFVPLCNQISITFEFGSSEYDGFQCASYNDGFGLFITGPNPSGGTYSSSNAAVLPNGTAVSISNINNGQAPCTSASNPSYYIDNSTGTDVIYEGLTTAITSVKPVVPCSTYHIKIAIADIGDAAYDSGVFIQGNSLNCANTPTITASTTPANCAIPGSATVTVTNYTATPTYQWLPGGATTPSVNNL